MAKLRPFNMLENFYESADANWFALPPAERISAFSAMSNMPRRAASFAGLPQSTTDPADEVLSAEPGTVLANAANLYQEKFGFIFVVCADGENSEELLAICNARLGNSVQSELQIATGEHRKIIEIRLNRLLEQ